MVNKNTYRKTHMKHIIFYDSLKGFFEIKFNTFKANTIKQKIEKYFDSPCKVQHQCQDDP